MQRQARRAVAGIVVLAAVVLTLIACGAAARASAAASATRARAAPAARTVVTFTWGGGLGDQMGALPVFQHYRMHATFYVPSGLVCQRGNGPGCPTRRT